jgi:chromosome segregation ATPase
MAEKADYKEIIQEYKDQKKILKDEIAELQTNNKAKDSALKRTTQKLENSTEDLDKANEEILKLKEEIKVLQNKPTKILTS